MVLLRVRGRFILVGAADGMTGRGFIPVPYCSPMHRTPLFHCVAKVVKSLKSSAKYLSEHGIAVHVYAEGHISCQRNGDNALEVSGTTTDRFVIVSWEYCPGPGPDDFRVTFKTLDEVLLAVWSFYFAKPVVVNGWIIPLHRRPYWDLPRLQYRLANAHHIDLAAFQAIEELRCQRAYASPPGPAAAEFTQFLPCQHRTEIDRSLMLKRDLEKAYVVSV